MLGGGVPSGVMAEFSFQNSSSASIVGSSSLKVVFVPHKSRYIALHVVP